MSTSRTGLIVLSFTVYRILERLYELFGNVYSFFPFLATGVQVVDAVEHRRITDRQPKATSIHIGSVPKKRTRKNGKAAPMAKWRRSGVPR